MGGAGRSARSEDAGEKLERTPLFDEHRALGARMVPFAGYEMPVQYSGIIEEHRAVRTSAGIFDVSHMAEVRVSGAGARGCLQRALTNDLERIDPIGRAQYTLMLREDGGILDDLIVYHVEPDEYLIVANAANRERVVAALTERCAPEAAVTDISDRTALIALQGPDALSVLSRLVPGGWEAPPRFAVARTQVSGVPALVARTGYTGEDGVEIMSAAEDAVVIWRALLATGAVTPCGLGARDTLRLEMGYPLYGSDIDETTDPVSAGLMWVVALSKGEFVGRAAVERLLASDTPLRLAHLRVEDGIARHGYPVLHEGQEVGKVASGSFSPTLGTGIATAYVPRDLAAPGTRLEVAIRAKRSGALVVRPPFVTSTSRASIAARHASDEGSA